MEGTGRSFLKGTETQDERWVTAQEKFRTGGRMILLRLVRWGEQLIRRISYQGDEVSLTAKKNGGREWEEEAAERAPGLGNS
jgi:hypothetical protein